MNSLKSIYFPGTDIYSIRQYPIFLLFQKLHAIQPVENEDTVEGEESADIFIKYGFCQVDTPCPLGEDRDRFLHLVEDIKNRRDDYAAQLSALTLASMSDHEDTSEGSEQAIIDQLFTPKSKTEKADNKHKEHLWKARLVLAIGEFLDREEEEIARNLAELDDDTTGILKELHGDETEESENPFAELMQIESKLGAARAGNAAKRSGAWRSLFLESDHTDSRLFVTCSRDAGDLLIEEFAKQTGSAATTVPGLTVPGLIGFNGKDALRNVEHFIKTNQSELAEIHECLSGFLKGDIDNSLVDTYKAAAASWNTELEKMFPESKYGRLACDLYLFPGLSCSHLLGSQKMTTDSSADNGLLLVID